MARVRPVRTTRHAQPSGAYITGAPAGLRSPGAPPLMCVKFSKMVVATDVVAPVGNAAASSVRRTATRSSPSTGSTFSGSGFPGRLIRT